METFRRGWWGWIRSSEGYSVRLMGHTRLQYRDQSGEVELFAEVLGKPMSTMVLDLRSFPPQAATSQERVVERVSRAFAYVGWNVIADGATTQGAE